MVSMCLTDERVRSRASAHLLHGLKQYLDLDGLSRLDAAAVGSDAVLLGGSRLDLECDWLLVGVGDLERALDELRQRAWR